jgi:subtilisin family serine protease
MSINVSRWIIYFLSVGMLASGLNAKGTSKRLLKYEFRPGTVIVKMKATTGLGKSVETAARSLGSRYNAMNVQSTFTTASLKKRVGIEELERIYTLHVSDVVDVRKLCYDLMNQPNVEYAEPDYLIPADFVPNDPRYTEVYPLAMVKAEQAWNIVQGDSTVIVAVLDSGVDWKHPDLAAAIWNNADEIPNNGIDDDGNGFIDDVRGWDFVDGVTDAWAGEDNTTPDNNPMDYNSHGTHVAGIVGAVTNNGVGISSLAGGIKIMPIRIAYHRNDGLGVGYTSWMSLGFIYAANNGASVVNLSYGTSPVLEDAAYYAFRNGVVICNSAGNSYSEDVSVLGTMPWVLSVASVNNNDQKATYSSYGVGVDVSAPGGDFGSGNRHGYLSTIVSPPGVGGSNTYAEYQGTSMASPLVASLAALIKSQHKTWTPAQIMFQICGTADNIDALNPAYVGKLGAGRINAYRAVTETPSAPKPKLSFVGVKIDDAIGGNGNGILEAGEQAKIIVEVQNDWGDAINLAGTLSGSNWAMTINKSTSTYGTLSGISNYQQSRKDNASDAFEISISPDAVPSSISLSVTLTADGGVTTTFGFNIAIDPRILVIDDDEGVHAEQWVIRDLEKLGVGFEVHDHLLFGTPTVAKLKAYGAVIWLCEWGFPSLDSLDRVVIKNFLDGGGKFFLSGQDIGWDLADVTGVPYNQYTNDPTTKTFYETYLKVNFVADDAKWSTLQGVAGDPIGNGLVFDRFEPEETAANQYPDVVDPNGGSVPIFKYTGGTYVNRTGAVRYDGTYKMVHFTFGGYESITDSTIRLEILNRILTWFFGGVTVEKLTDTENSTGPYPVHAQVSSKDSVVSAILYYDTDGAMPFNKATMTQLDSVHFQASIPAPASASDIEYFVLVKTKSSYLAYTKNKFHVGADIVPPMIVSADSISSSIKLQGPYSMGMLATDNVGVDTNGVILHYAINAGTEATVKFNRVVRPDSFAVALVPSTKLKSGDEVSYFVTVSDIASVKNQTRYPTTGVMKFAIGREMIDDFETTIPGKWNYGGWDYTTSYRVQPGLRSITDSPTGYYLPNTENILEYLLPLDLSGFTNAQLSYSRRTLIDTTDALYLEVTKDGSKWDILKKINGIIPFGWTLDRVSLDGYTGVGCQAVRIRFRMKTDGSLQNDGVFIDNLDIVTNAMVGVGRNEAGMPVRFGLGQNYPNPFNPTTTIEFSTPSAVYLTLTVYDVLGREIVRLADGFFEAGNHKTTFDARNLPSGVYLYRLNAGTFSDTKRLLIMK